MRFVTSILFFGLLLSAFSLLPANAIAPFSASDHLLLANNSHQVQLVARGNRPKHRGSGRRDLMEQTQPVWELV